MPYKCRYCGGVYCSDHRLPENHRCEGLTRIRENPRWKDYAAEVRRRQTEAKRSTSQDRWDREEARGHRFLRGSPFSRGPSDGTQGMRTYLLAILLVSVVAAIAIKVLL